MFIIVKSLFNNLRGKTMLRLNTIGKNITKNNRPISGTVVGVVVDISKPLHKEKEGIYIQMIKIIDETLNDKNIFGVMSKDCCVYILSKKKEDLDFLKGVGDIVILDKFTFSLWNGIIL